MEPAGMPMLEPLVMSLVARAPRMSFMQLCRLFEACAPSRPGLGTRDTLEDEPIRFRPRPRLGFPAGEIAAVEFDDEDGRAPPTVRTTFMGLYGVDAAVPSHMVDEIALREEGHDAVEAFLDQFNHRFVTLLFRAWKKYRYPESFRAGGVDAHSLNLLCLAGFGWGDKPSRAGLPASRMLALLGLLVQRTRTPEGLAGVIALAAPGASVRVDEFWPVAARTGTPCPLTSTVMQDDAPVAGASAQARSRRGLGSGYVLGKRIIYRSRAVCATLSPADARQAHELLPGAWLHRELIAYVRLYAGVKADVHLRMTIPSGLAPPPLLGAPAVAAVPAPRLGWTTVLPSADEHTLNIALGVCEALPASTPNPYL